MNKVLLYDEGAAQALNLEEVAQYLRKRLEKVTVELKGNPFALYLTQDRSLECARKIASTKIQDTTRRMLSGQEPLYGEIEFEKQRIFGKTRAFGILYDGLALQRLFFSLLPREERSFEFAHIFFTNRLFATWDVNNRRYHARASLYGVPSIVSTTGLVEAPAKPREYYFLKQQFEMLGKDVLELKDGFRGRFIDYDDERVTEVIKGYAMQAVFHSLVGDPFCLDKGCRLYNAHWQEELVFAQLESEYEFCDRHGEIVNSLGGK